MNIKITADSTCDLPEELIKKYDINIVPIYIIKGEDSLKDGVEITPAEVFEYADRTNELCRTSAPSVVDYATIFSRLRKECDCVIHLSLSSVISASCQDAKIAAEEVGGVYVIDTLNLSTGSGHLVLKTAEFVQQGLPVEEVIAKVEALIPKVETSFVLDTLKYMRMGGRCSSVTELGANLLKIKPCIEVKDGKMDVEKKYRGRFEKAIMNYIEDRLVGRDDLDTSRIFITHSEMPDEIFRMVYDRVSEMGIFDEILTSTAGCTVSTHCGPCCLGVLFFRK